MTGRIKLASNWSRECHYSYQWPRKQQVEMLLITFTYHFLPIPTLRNVTLHKGGIGSVAIHFIIYWEILTEFLDNFQLVRRNIICACLSLILLYTLIWMSIVFNYWKFSSWVSFILNWNIFSRETALLMTYEHCRRSSWYLQWDEKIQEK